MLCLRDAYNTCSNNPFHVISTIIDPSYAGLNIFLLVLFFSSGNSKSFLKFIKLSFDLRVLMRVCSICLHMFSNSSCSFGGGVDDEGIFTREVSWKFEFLK